MKHIVIVDDDRINLDCATMALGDKYKITTLGSGKQAVQTIPGDVPDLLLLDVSMPFVDGFAVAEQLRAAQSPIPNPQSPIPNPQSPLLFKNLN